MKTDGSADRLDSRLIGTLVSVNVSGGGVPKSRVNGAQVSRLGPVGDAQDDTIHHGGPDRAVCVYSRECCPRVRSTSATRSKSTQGPNNKGRVAPRTAPLLNSRTDPHRPRAGRPGDSRTPRAAGP